MYNPDLLGWAISCILLNFGAFMHIFIVIYVACNQTPLT